jgi:indolepyruvate ferredoxin oxidoreductase
VIAHLKVAPTPQDIRTIRVAAGGADLVLGCDIIVAASEKVLSTVRGGHTKMVVNSHEAMPADFTQNADYVMPSRLMNVTMEARAGKARVDYVEATRLATALTGNSIAANLFMLGFAWQKGTIPVSGEALDRAIELNGVAVEMNRQAFIWGRRAAHDLARVEALIAPEPGADDMHHASHGLDEQVERRVAFLIDYQNAAYASRYKDLVDRVARAEAARAGGQSGLAEAVARYYFKLMAYKDEYEVARLYTDGSFERQVAAQFDGDYKLEFNLAPPILAKRDPDTGHLRKQTFGPWMMTAFRWLARARGLRGTAFDIFGYSPERRTERGLIGEYEAVVSEIMETLTPDNHDLAVEIARMPERIRGYGHVKQRHLAEAKATEAALLADYRAGKAARKAVA